MLPYITETLEQARCLLNLAIQHGSGAFSAGITSYVEALAERHSGQPSEINRRLMALTSGFLALLFEGQTERIIRNQLQLSESFVNEPDPREKISRFLQRINEFVEMHTAHGDERALSSRVRITLRMYSLKELRGVSVASLAKAYGYHPDHFTRKLRAECGQLPSDFIQEEKLNRAALFIKQRPNGSSLKEISYSLGFQDYPHFRELMKKRFGQAPSRL